MKGITTTNKQTIILLSVSLLAAAPLGAQNDASIVRDPIAHAWELFAKLNAPVANDQEGRVQWETWMLGRVVFADPNKAPVWNAAVPTARTRATFESMPLQELIRQQRRQGSTPGVIQPQFDPTVGVNNETRMNKATFDFIVKNDLYYAQGIEAFAKKGNKFDFPPDAMEVKAQWRPITLAQASRFHTAKVQGITGQQELWGLTAMHITTKELPNWFWATFEHKDNAEHEGVLPDVKPQKQPSSFQGTKWENYVLRGTQLEFTDSIGRPTRLASSQIEDGFQQTSSCISCHALATVNPQQPAPGRINFLDFFDQNGNGFIGVPDKQKFLAPGSETQMRYVQLDFVWSLFRAQRRAP